MGWQLEGLARERWQPSVRWGQSVLLPDCPSSPKQKQDGKEVKANTSGPGKAPPYPLVHVPNSLRPSRLQPLTEAITSFPQTLTKLRTPIPQSCRRRQGRKRH